MCMKRMTSYLVPVLAILLALSGCSYLGIETRDNANLKDERTGTGEDARFEYNSAVVMGTLKSGDSGRYPAAVAAYAMSASGGAVADYAVLDGTGSFMLYLPAGRYRLYAACDFNGDGAFDESEICGAYGDSPDSPREIVLREGVVAKDVEISTNRARAGTIKTPGMLDLRHNGETVRQRGENGEIVKIYDERFSRENAAAGWWSPSGFMKAFGARIYMLEPYDPAKIPVLFVHGARGTPQDWVYFLIRLDRRRYQPWFYYYPSGMRLTLATSLLYEDLSELHKKYGFRKMGIAAHSVGGLIARSLLTRYDLDEPDGYVRLYATFATPWTGFPMADVATAIPQKKIPCWYDVGTQSPFISRTLNAHLSQRVNHYLFYGRHDRVAGNGATDQRAVSNARGAFAFDCTHESILSDRAVFRKFSEIMDRELKGGGRDGRGEDAGPRKTVERKPQ